MSLITNLLFRGVFLCLKPSFQFILDPILITGVVHTFRAHLHATEETN